MATMPIHEAAQRLGVSPDTIRRRIRRGELNATKEETPQGYLWMVEVPEDEPMQGHMQGDDAHGQEHRHDWQEASGGEVRALRDLVGALQAQISSQQEELEARRREVQELHILLQHAQKALPTPAQEEKGWWRRLVGSRS
jgi:hypothetical protein